MRVACTAQEVDPDALQDEVVNKCNHRAEQDRACSIQHEVPTAAASLPT
jgi:hypothetical protein